MKNNMKMKKKVRINENNLTASQRSMYDMNQVGKQDAKPVNCNLLGLNKGPFGLFLFHWNKVCTSENPQKSEKKSERAPWPCSSGTFQWNNFFLPKSYFLQFGSAVLLLSF